MTTSILTLKREGLQQLDLYLPRLKEYSQLVLLSDSTVISLYGTEIRSALKRLNNSYLEIVISEGEKEKSLSQVTECWHHMFSAGVDRQAALVACGGGLISDIGGFIASCYMRGIDSYYIPTTLMAMVDAAVGGKTAVNLQSGKNIIGSFHLPRHIFIDPMCLRSLPQREFNSGLAEIIKYGITCDPLLFEELEQNLEELNNREGYFLDKVIQRCIDIKQHIVSEDFKDLSGKRSILNYGHTIGHAIEAMTDYQHYLHGEAISIGMSCAIHLSAKLSLCHDSLIKRQDQLCRRAHLPTDLPPLSIDQFMKTIRGDKKSVYGKINLILLERIGKAVKVCDVNPIQIKEMLCHKMGSSG